MKAVICRSFEGIESLSIDDIDPPVVEPDTAIVRVQSVALNFFDTLIIKGRYQYKPDLPFSPGAEIAGIVEEVGGKVEGFKTGDRVSAYLKWGGCRELVGIKASELIPIPENVSEDVASGINVTYGTVMHAFCDRAYLKKGETVAVLGASGGVGLAAVEIAKIMGAKVIACASSAEKLRIAGDFGADELVDYSKDNLKEKLKSLTEGQGVNVVFDPVGGELAELAIRATRWRGRYLTIGFASGTIPKIPLNLTLLKGCDILGVFWGDALVREPEKNRLNISQVFDWISNGRIKPFIHGTYPLSKTREALEEISQRRAIGKVVIKPQE